jgi:TfoX/Sxy family transcriptional regulator of competence genes
MKQPDERSLHLLERVEARLAGRPARRVSMFGTIAVMVDGAKLVAVGKDHSLLVRVHPDDDEVLLARPDATRPEMGSGRSMGVGWIRVDAAAIEDDETLDLWLAHAFSRTERET